MGCLCWGRYCDESKKATQIYNPVIFFECVCACLCTSVSAWLVLCGWSCCKGVLSLVGSFITVYFPMPVVISSRISVNCHPVTGRLHVGHRRPLLPTGLTESGPLAVTRNWESANPEERPPSGFPWLGHLSPHHRAHAPAPGLAQWMS